MVAAQNDRDALRRAADNQTFISEAPICLVFCTDAARSAQRFGARGETLYAVQDATIAAAYAQLAIVAAGMGSTWVGNFDAAQIRQALNIPAELTPVALLSVGYPAELPEATARRRIDEIVTYR